MFDRYFKHWAIEIRFLIPVIPQNMLKHHAEKSLNMTQLTSLKKIHTKIIIMKRNIELNDLRCSCPDLYRLILQTFYHTSFLDYDITKTGNWWTVNFRNCLKLFTNKFDTFFVSFWHPIFKQEKWNEVTRHMKHAAIAITYTLLKL